MGPIQSLPSAIPDNKEHKKIPNTVFMIQAHNSNSSVRDFTFCPLPAIKTMYPDR